MPEREDDQLVDVTELADTVPPEYAPKMSKRIGQITSAIPVVLMLAVFYIIVAYPELEVIFFFEELRMPAFFVLWMFQIALPVLIKLGMYPMLLARTGRLLTIIPVIDNIFIDKYDMVIAKNVKGELLIREITPSLDEVQKVKKEVT